MNDHVTKPIDPDALFSVLLRWVKPGDRKVAAVVERAKVVEASARATIAAEMLDLPGIDRASGLKRVAGNEALYQTLILDFHRDYALSLQGIRRALDESRVQDAERLVHTLKGVAGNIGANALHEAARELDDAIRREALAEDLAGLLGRAEDELGVVIKGLEPLAKAKAARTEGTSEPAGEVDKAALLEALVVLTDLIRKNDPEAESALEPVRQALKGGRAREADKIAQAIDLFDFRAAARAVAALAEAEGLTLP